jgi:hypothetical protein
MPDNPIATIDTLVNDYTGALQQLGWERMARKGMAGEILVLNNQNTILRTILGTLLHANGSSTTLRITAPMVQAFFNSRLQPIMVQEPESHDWILSLVSGEQKV